MKATVDRLYEEQDSITGVVITSAKKTFFAGGDLRNIIAIGPDDAQAAFDEVQGIKPTCVASRPSVSPSSPPSTARLSVAVSRSLSRRTTASPPTSRASRSVCPRPASACSPVAVVSPHRAPARHPDRSALGSAAGQQVQRCQGQGDRPGPRRRGQRRGARPGRQGMDQGQPRGRRPAWDVKGYKIPGGTPSSPAFAANLPAFPANLRKQIKGAPMPAPRAIMPPPSRAPRSTSTTPRPSSRGTSSSSPPARSRRT